MARVHGRNGQLYVGISGTSSSAESIAFIKSWSIDFSTDDVDVTAFGDSNKVTVSGLPSATGSFSGFYDDATAQLYTAASDGGARRFYLYPKTPSTAGPYWFGTATFDFSVETPVDGAVTVSGNFAAASIVAKVG